MTEYLDLDDVLEIARQAVEGDVAVGDYGLLESALSNRSGHANLIFEGRCFTFVADPPRLRQC